MSAPSPVEPLAPAIAIEVFGRSAVICLPGDLDRHDADDVGEVVAHAIRCGHHHLVLDFTATTFLDCHSLRAILRALEVLERFEHADVVLAGVSGHVARLLAVLEADLLFTTFPTRAAALRTLRDPSRPPNAGWRTISLPSLIPPSPQPVPIAPPDRLPRWSPEERVQIA